LTSKDEPKEGDLPEPAPGNVEEETGAQKVLLQPVEQELRTSFMDYAMSVIVSRALPDVRDGLKPVHRRVLYAMGDMGLTADRAYRKSALVVGDTMGKYHPHGDQAIYDTLVRMAQPFSMRIPLIDGQGNFGSVDGDRAAAMRYTEARLARMAQALLEDIGKETVDFRPNYDGSRQEPVVLPAKAPNLLINGASGIAVGMATNIPPHNLGEVVDGLVHLIQNPQAELADLAQFIKGPDFPTGGIIMGRSGLAEAFATGRGKVVLRGRYTVEELRGDRRAIIVSELPYTVNKANLLVAIAGLVKAKKVEGISDLRDESDRDGMRMVIELKRDADPEVVVNALFAHTQMQITFGVNNLALVGQKPIVLTLKKLLEHFLAHREDVVTRRTRFDLRKAEERAHVLEGLLIALDNVDEVIKIIRGSKTAEDAGKELVARFAMTEIQAKAILDMRLAKLAALEAQQVRDEHAEVQKKIARFKQILSDRSEVLTIIKDELLELKDKFGDARRTEILEQEAEMIGLEELIPEHQVVITQTKAGYIKRLPVDTYRAQGRGGKGLVAMETKEDDFLTEIFTTSSHDYLLFFTSKGGVHRLKAYQVPQGSRYSRGKAIPNLLPRLGPEERVQQAIPIRDFADDRFVFFATRRGVVKRSRLSDFKNINIAGLRAINLDEDDELIGIRITDGSEQIILATAQGQAIRFDESAVRAMGRAARGVIGVRLGKGDEVVSMAVVHGQELLTVTRNGYGKRTPVDEYRHTNRGGKGVRTIVVEGRNGPVVDVREVTHDDELILTTRLGMLVRLRAADIRSQGRSTMGVRVMRLKDEDQVVAVAKILSPTEEAELVGEELPPKDPSSNGAPRPDGSPASADE
jgi:DNA gyrase subunit A